MLASNLLSIKSWKFGKPRCIGTEEAADINLMHYLRFFGWCGTWLSGVPVSHLLKLLVSSKIIILLSSFGTWNHQIFFLTLPKTSCENHDCIPMLLHIDRKIVHFMIWPEIEPFSLNSSMKIDFWDNFGTFSAPNFRLWIKILAKNFAWFFHQNRANKSLCK